MNEQTKLMWEHLADSLISYNTYGEQITAGLVYTICLETICEMMESTPEAYDFLLDCIDVADFVQIANLVNQTK